MMNVLITSASRKVSLLRAFREALGRLGGGQVVAVDARPLAAALYLADDHYLVPATDDPGFVDGMVKLCARLNIRLLIPTRDEELPIFAETKERFARVGTTVMICSPSTVQLCQNKTAFIRFCQDAGIGVPVTYHAQAIPSTLRFPLFIKPAKGKGSRLTARIASFDELQWALRSLPEAMVQEWIEAPEYTIDLFADFDGHVISVVPRERIVVLGGEAFISRTHRHSGLIDAAVTLASKLGLVGHNTIQCFLDGHSVKFIEVNPRFGGGASLGFAAGAHTPTYLVRLLSGEVVETRIGEFIDNFYMLRYTEDLFLSADALTTRLG